MTEPIIVTLLVIIFFVYQTFYIIYRFKKEKFLDKRLANYNEEEVLFQNSNITMRLWVPYWISCFTILTNKKIYLYTFNPFFLIHWEIENKLIKNIEYKPKKPLIFKNRILYYLIKINNHKRHLISSKDEFDIFIKRLKTINHSIKISEMK